MERESAALPGQNDAAQSSAGKTISTAGVTVRGAGHGTVPPVVLVRLPRVRSVWTPHPERTLPPVQAIFKGSSPRLAQIRSLERAERVRQPQNRSNRGRRFLHSYPP